MMKVKRFLRTAATLAALLATLLAASLLAACDQAALPEVLPYTEASVPGTGTGMGTVTVRATAGAGALGAVRSREAGTARTVAPGAAEFASAFDTFELSFAPQDGGAAVVKETADPDGTPVKLPEGVYTLTVTARKSTVAIATGTASVTVKIDEPKTVEVFLSPTTEGADGTFSYNVTLPADTQGALTLTGPEKRKIPLSSGGNNATANLPPGEYQMAGIIFKGAERVNFTNEAVYLYSGMTSTFTRNFSSVELIEKTAADILASLSDADENDIDHPYPLDLSGLTLADLTKDSDPLGELFASLSDNIYVDLDLSGCNITEIGNIASAIATSRPNKDKIVSVTLPESLGSLGNYAFYNCKSLTTIDLPESLESIGNYAFAGCSSLEIIDLSNTDLESIGTYAFTRCTKLATIDLPDSLESIGNSAFYDCTSLTTIDLPESLTNIRGSAFYGCTSLTTIDLPESLTTIGTYAFQDCTKLVSVISHNTTPPTLGNDAFYNTSSSLSIKVPSGSVDAYQSVWTAYSGKITAL